MPRRGWISYLVIGAACLSLAACGSSSSSSSGNGTLSKDELIKQANKVCGQAGDQVDQLGSTPTDAAGVSAYMDKAAGIMSGTATALRDLKPPPEIASDYNRFVELIAKVGSDSGEIAALERSKDAAKLTQVSADLKQASTEGQTVAKRIGLSDACTG